MKHIFTLPDFADGCIKGAGIGIMLLSLIYSVRNKQLNNHFTY